MYTYTCMFAITFYDVHVYTTCPQERTSAQRFTGYFMVGFGVNQGRFRDYLGLLFRFGAI